MKHEKDILKDDKWLVEMFSETLRKSEGEINWDYGFKNNLKKFAGVDPKRTVKMIRDFLLLRGELNPHRQSPLFIVDSEIKEALEIIYKKAELREDVDKLVNDLIEKGGSMFWGLKDILKK